MNDAYGNFGLKRTFATAQATSLGQAADIVMLKYHSFGNEVKEVSCGTSADARILVRLVAKVGQGTGMRLDYEESGDPSYCLSTAQSCLPVSLP